MTFLKLDCLRDSRVDVPALFFRLSDLGNLLYLDRAAVFLSIHIGALRLEVLLGPQLVG